jgi:protein TonB
MQIASHSFYLNRTHFAAMLAVALAVHMVLAVAWLLSPGLKVNKIPVHVLNIKLGSGDVSSMTSLSTIDSQEVKAAKMAAQPDPVPPPHENERTEAPAPPAQKKPDAEKVPDTQKDSGANKAAATKKGEVINSRSFAPSSSASNAPLAANARPSQYIRRSGDANGRGIGSAVGNTIDPQADIMQRYTQLISMWINRHREILNRALQPGMKGNVVIRLRIDRMGNIHYFKLDKATGVPVVDAAAADMVRAANPVPPVPSNYPGGNMFEFLIPVGYIFQQ